MERADLLSLSMTDEILLAFAISVGLTFSLVFLSGRDRGVGLSKIKSLNI